MNRLTEASLEPHRQDGLRERRPSSYAANSKRLAFTSTAISPNQPVHDHEAAVDDEGDDKTSHFSVRTDEASPKDVTISIPTAVVPSDHHFGAAPGLSLPQTPATLTPTHTIRSNPLEDAPVISTRIKPDRYKFRLASGFFFFFCAGWSDGTPGTIIPHLEDYYKLSHFTVSFLFVSATVGFGIGTIIMEPLLILLGRFCFNNKRRTFIPYLFPNLFSRGSSSEVALMGYSLSQGRMWVLVIACLFHITYFVVAASRPPFWGLLVGFFCSGVAVSMVSGQLNGYVAASSVRTQGRALGTLHGFYGVGAFASPLVSQSVLAAGWKWEQFYYTSIALGVINLIGVILTFHTTQAEFQREKEQAAESANANEGAIELDEGSQMPVANSSRARSRSPRRSGNQPKSTMRTALSIPYVWVFMVFLMIYTGSETTTGGWIVTYLLKERNANPDTVGYVASGFWGGLALGRIALGNLSPYLGLRKEKHLVHVYILLCIAMTFIIWFVPSFIGNAVCAAMIGALLGPIFPTSLSLATKLLPKEVHLTALAAMSSFASIGSALFPFAAGALASARGVAAIQPFMLAILSTMGVLWCFFPARAGMTS